LTIRVEDANNNAEKTEVLHGIGNVINAELQFFSITKKKLDTCMNYTRPQLAVIIEPIMKAFVDARSRGVRLRYITEITHDNITACKQLMEIVDELRHLDGIKGNFMVSEAEYLAPVILFEKGKIASQIVYSNVKELVEQQQYTFESFWSKAIPAHEKISEIEENISIQRTQLVYGQENATNTILRAMSNAKNTWDTCIESRSAAISVGAVLKGGYSDAKSRGVKMRYITEITKDNVKYCKEIAKVAEVRHLDGIKSNFGVSETEYAAGINSSQQENLISLDQLIYSNVIKLVQQQKFIFETLWRKSIPADQKIEEIEEGILPIRTRLLEYQDEIIKEIKLLNNSAEKLSICSGFGGMQLSYKYFFDSYKRIANKSRKKEEGVDGLRWIISIDKDSLMLVKAYLESGFQIKHIKNMLPINFGVSDKQVALTIEKMEGGKMSPSFLISNEPLYVNHFNSVFEDLWNTGVDAAERIKDIEEGVDLADIEVIRSPAKAQDLCLDIVKSAAEEILLMLPTTNSFIRQDKIGVIDFARQAAKERNVKIRILMPVDVLGEHKVQNLKQVQEQQEQKLRNNIDVRHIEQTQESKATVFVVDRKVSLIMEIRDDTKETFAEAIGLSTYSNSKAGVLSYVAIFESLWIQSYLSEQLKNHDKAQKEFINLAAHELRTPIQPVLGLAQLLRSKTIDVEQQELLEVIIRNAKRSHRLTEDILDVTRIESQSLQLNKERFNLKDAITNIIDDTNTNDKMIEKNNNAVIHLLYNHQPQDIIIEADKARITQVISNLLSNAFRFTPGVSVGEKREGTVIISTENIDNNQKVIVSVKDTGIGIDPEIMPKLFTKFTARSHHGTGLGLFISKSIVEAHAGRIWAENNPDGRGATFYFTLPLITR